MCLGVPGQIVEVVSDDFQIATVDVGGVRRGVHTGLVTADDEIAPGDWVLVHVGFAIARIDEAEAQATLDRLTEMGTAYDDALADFRASRIE